MKVEFDNGRKSVEWSDNAVIVRNGTRRTVVLDTDMQDILVALLQENVSMRKKFKDLLDASNKAVREQRKAAKT